MRILITGGTGLIGTLLTEELFKRGHSLVLLTRDPKKAKKQFNFPCEFFAWDPSKDLPPRVAFEGAEAVIHLLGENVAAKRWSVLQKKKIYDSRIKSTKAIAQAIEEYDNHKIETFICSSAVGYYGSRGDEILNESSTAGKDFLAEVCVDWEKFSKVSKPIRTVNVRTAFVLSKSLEPLFKIFKLGLGGVVGPGTQWMSWIHLKDIVSIYVYCLEHGDIEGAVNGTAPNPLTNKNFTKTIGKILNRPTFLAVPQFALKMIAGERANLLLSSMRVFPEKISKKGFRFHFATIDEAIKDLTQGSEKLVFKQFITKNTQEVFTFFADEKNLELLTPRWLSFHVKDKSTETIQEGTLINYKLKIKNVPTRWQSKIIEWEPNKKFIDTQIKGPYALWHHTHLFEETPKGTWMTDIIRYRVPLGILGRWVVGRMVRKDVQKIFQFRKEKIDQIFRV